MTEDDFVAFLRYSFPLFTSDDIEKVLFYYPSSNASDGSTRPSFATSGTSGATALNQSTFATGQQQRANVSIRPKDVSGQISSSPIFFSHKPSLSAGRGGG